MGERLNKLLAAMDPVGKNVPQLVNSQQQAIKSVMMCHCSLRMRLPAS